MEPIPEFIKRLKSALPNTEIISGWPSETDAAVYPFASVLRVQGTFESYNPQLKSSQGDKHIFYVGDAIERLDMHYFFKEPPQYDSAVSAISALFGAPHKEGADAVLNIPYGEGRSAYFRLIGHDLATEGGALRAGERRVIFRIQARWPRFSERVIPVMKDIQLKPTIKEGRIDD